MTLDEFFDKYYFHDSDLLEIIRENDRLTLLINFCFWMQDWYRESEPENGYIRVVFEGVEDYEGIVGKVDLEILDLEMENGGVYALLEDGVALVKGAVDQAFYKLRFKAKSAWVEKVMIKKIRLLLEFQTYCLWLYNEDDEIIDNDNPPEWDDDQELTNAFLAVSDVYDTFFIDTPKEFSYIGPPDEETVVKLKALFEKALDLLMKKNNGKYIIQNDVDIDELLSVPPDTRD